MCDDIITPLPDSHPDVIAARKVKATGGALMGEQARERAESLKYLAERLIGMIDAIEGGEFADRRNGHLAAYECDARLIAREYLALLNRLERAERSIRLCSGPCSRAYFTSQEATDAA